MSYTLTPVVKRRLKKVRDLILAEPKQFAMEEFIAKNRRAAKAGDTSLRDDVPTLPQALKCGTTCCIAGWYHLVTPKKERGTWIGETLQQALNASAFEDAVIYATMWPEPFKARYAKAKGPKAQARVAAARIDHLLATGE